MEKEKKEYVDIKLVKALMAARGVDEKTMAGLIGVSLQTVKRFLSGADQKHMRADRPVKIAKALDVTVSTVLHEEYR